MPTLTIGAGTRSRTVLTFSTEVVVGRGATADLTIPDPSISRTHARFTFRDHQCFVQDLQSANGTRVNGISAIDPRSVATGDVIEFGFVHAIFGDVEKSGGKDVPTEPLVEYRDDGQSPQVLYALPVEQHEVSAAAATGPQVSLQKYLKFIEGLASVSEMVFETQAVLDFAAEQLLTLMPAADRAFVMLSRGPKGELEPAIARTRSGKVGEIVASRTLLKDVVDRRAAVLVVDTKGDARFAGSESIHTIGIRSAISAPIIFQGDLHGVLQIDTVAGIPFDNADVALVLALASQVGLALATARLHETLLRRGQLDHDMQLATRLQQQFLPTEPPTVPGYSFTFINEPALGVGGDFFEFLELGDNRLGVVIGDVSGKGVSAALYAAKLTSDLRYQAAGQTRPGDILARVNRALGGRNREGMFATAAVAVLDTTNGRIEVASAGHPSPIVCEAGGRVVPLGQTGSLPLGLAPDTAFPQHTYMLEPRSTVLFYTDGVTEALNKDQKIFGDDRVLEACRSAKGSVVDRTTHLRSAVRAFVRDEPPSDDLTIVGLQRLN